MRFDIRIINSFENKYTILPAEAPNTFRTPTSFVRCTAIKETDPYKPKQEIILIFPQIFYRELR